MNGASPQRRGVLAAQIDLIRGTVHPNRTISSAGPIKIILESGGHLLCHPGLLAALGYPRQDQLQSAGTEARQATPADALARP